MRGGKFFLDTNVFIYAFDKGQALKQKRSLALIEEAIRTGQGLISYQVIQEFLAVAIRKFPNVLSQEECLKWMEKVLSPLCEHYPSSDFYVRALKTMQRGGWSFYDSLIIQAAIDQQCSILYSEDLQHGRVIEGMKIQNPYLALGKG